MYFKLQIEEEDYEEEAEDLPPSKKQKLANNKSAKKKWTIYKNIVLLILETKQINTYKILSTNRDGILISIEFP